MLGDVMKIAGGIFTALVWLGASGAYAANTIFMDRTSPNFALDSDLIINESVRFTVLNQITVSGVVNLENNGIIDGDFVLNDGAHLTIRNRGTIDGTFTTGRDAVVTQVVQSSADLHPLNGADGFNVLINSGSDNILSLSDVRNVIANAGTVQITNSSLVADSLTGPARGIATDGPDVELDGIVTIYATSVDDLLGRPVLSGVHGDGIILFRADNMNPMYALRSDVRGGNVYAVLSRETDYVKILRNAQGEFINKLRGENPDDPLVVALDNATNMDELNNLIAESARMNPVLLMRPVRMFNTWVAQDMGRMDDGIYASPMYMFSDDFHVMGISLGGGFDLSEHIQMTVTGYGAMMDYAGDVDVYDGALYSGNVHIGYNGELLFARAMVGLTAARFDTGSVLADGEITENPSGLSGYGVGDFGVRVAFGNWTLAPFVRGGIDYVTVAGIDDTDSFVGGGSDIIFDSVGGDIRYQYGLRGGVDTRGVMDLSVRMLARSDADGAGGHVDVGVIYDTDMGMAYNIRIGAHVAF